MDELQARIDANAKPGEPRVTPDAVQGAIASEHYFRAADGIIGVAFVAQATGAPDPTPDAMPQPLELVTFCVLVLQNGFTVVGTSAVLSAANFDAQVGRDVARRDAVAKLWPLMGFRALDRLADEVSARNEEIARMHG